MITVAKFGGTSMADANSIRAVADILRQDDSRRVAVVSAPGCTVKYPDKVTDLLYANELRHVEQRFSEIMTDLGLDTTPLSGMCRWVAAAPQKNQVAFGEYMNAYILAKYLNWKFVDARRLFTLSSDGYCLYNGAFWSRLVLQEDAKMVIPGFYGAAYAGGIELFPRGGSDISGALAAEAVSAKLYENWTDVSGIYTADPRKSPTAMHLPLLTYREAAMLALSGATVFHPDAIAPVARKGIPVHVRNTFVPDDRGTLIVANKQHYYDPSTWGVIFCTNN